MQIVPISTDANQVFRTTLNAQNVSIQMRWQDISESWFISVFNPDESIVYIENKRININRIVLQDQQLTGFLGGFLARSESQPDVDLKRDSFQNGYNLYYLTPDEITQVRTANVI